MGEFDDLIGEFVTESREHIADIEEDLIKIEAEMENVDPEVINRVFRAAHSIKGSAKFLDLTNIGDLAHKLEDVLNLIRSGKVIPSSEIATPLLQAADMLKTMFEDVTASNEMDISENTTQLQGIIDCAGSPAAPKRKPAPKPKTEDILSPFKIDSRNLLKKLETTQVYILDVNLQNDNLDEFMDELANLGEVMSSHTTKKGGTSILFSTIIEPDMISTALKIGNDSFIQVLPDMIGQPVPNKPKPQAKAPEPKPQAKKMPEAAKKQPAFEENYIQEEDVEVLREEIEERPLPVKEKILLKTEEEEEKKEENISFITFSLESETYAVPIQAIEEIIGFQDISLLPNVPDFIKGVINLRGELVPVMDLRLKFGLEQKEYNPLTVFLIVRVEERVMGLVVDNVADVLVIDPSRVQMTPVFSAKISTDFIEGVYKDTQNQMVILVNVAALTKPEEWEVLAA